MSSEEPPGSAGTRGLPLPFALDFYPLQAPEFTRIHPFFDNLRKGKLTTTNCTRCGAVHWQPRVQFDVGEVVPADQVVIGHQDRAHL